MLSIVTSKCQFGNTLENGTVVVESDKSGPPFHDAFEELKDRRAVDLATKYADSQGISPAWLNGSVGSPYPVNKHGVPLEEVRGPNGKPLPQTHEDMQPALYRVDIKVQRPIR